MTLTTLKTKITKILKESGFEKSQNTKSIIKATSLCSRGFYYTKGDNKFECTLSYLDRDLAARQRKIKEMYDSITNKIDESWIELKENYIILYGYDD